ncbi:membrane protein insertase YidC [Sphingomonas japonica]|uniref:Membrane protein insertase YidC n=1 Tax=Sphingomonas japonica TaxID=511662 RepID=A0ABX0U2A5_9SPHN|nr:membrane protein insertase YidC [Sphingomonas japonica]NIJ24695.1 YidC/Oxa1 family membrane protein insertase [Sphingomonas japonica]
MKDEQKNFLLFALLAAAILFGWPYLAGTFFPTANPPATRIEQGKSEAIPAPSADPTADSPAAVRSRAVVLAETPRIRIDTPTLSGSINLRGPRIDDLILKKYDETVADNSAPIRLLSPSGAPDAYFAGFGWRDTGLQAPGPDTVWRATGDVLAPGKPVILDAANAAGQRFRIELAVDDQYMFTIKQTVANAGGQPVTVAPYALVNRSGVFHDKDSWTIHIGPMSVANGVANYDTDFDELDEAPETFDSTGGWLGFTDKYWLTALIPDQGKDMAGQFRSGANGAYQADYTVQPQQLAAGSAVTHTSRFFAGAKEVRAIDDYEANLGIAQFDKAIDWGWFRIIEKPIFYYLDWVFRMVNNFGLAIILLTLTVRLIMFPIAQKQFASMAGMRAVQPKLKALQERYKDDKPRLQQEMMKLYKDEKVNPLAGCLPMLLQIPIFYALYKVLMLTIEMRHQPFILWIKDLSAPDPLTPINLFGLLPFTPPSFIAIGVFPILLGISMYFQFKLNPQPTDDVQKQVFAIMPWVLMFVMAPFAVGLQVYWITTNVLTIAQQQWLYSKHPALRQAPAK